MSIWRKKAIACAPELKKDFERPETTIYTVFFLLLAKAEQAHKERDHETLRPIYEFAEWCHYNKAKDIWNAVGTSFYEHLGDEPETFAAFTLYIKKEIYFDIRDLLTHRFSDEQIKHLDTCYGWKAKLPGKNLKK